MRLFVGIGLPDAARAAVERALLAQPVPGKPTPPAGWHLTLFFLGQVDESRVPSLLGGLKGTQLGPPFELTVTGAGAFPHAAAARALWLGLGGDLVRLRSLQAAVTALVAPFGFAPEDRAYAPHLTLARIAPPTDVRPYLAALPPLSVLWPVTHVTLFRSAPDPHGSVYTPVADTALLA